MRETDVYKIMGYLMGLWNTGLGSSRTLKDWVEKSLVAYPGVDLTLEARRAAVWESSRPSRKKKDIRRFLSNWWSRAQQNADRRGDGKGNTVVSIDSMRWLKRADKAPEKTLSRWMKGRGDLTPELVEKFSSYYSVPMPDSVPEVINLYSGRGGE
tara:strand:+ start:325 stop:789 length:465 start_codon:yes stop_codon:yes gene_type:complete